MKKIVDIPFAQNTYVITRDKNAIVIDPGFNGKKTLEYLKENNLSLKAMLITHYHFDHVRDIALINKELGTKAYINKHEKEYIFKDTLAVQFGFDEVIVVPKHIEFFDKDLNIEGFKIKLLHLPGHSKGTTCFLLEEGMFTGDFMFYDSLGRIDLPGSDQEVMVKSIHTVKEWSSNLDIHPGHGPSAKFGELLQHNKLLAGILRK